MLISLFALLILICVHYCIDVVAVVEMNSIQLPMLFITTIDILSFQDHLFLNYVTVKIEEHFEIDVL